MVSGRHIAVIVYNVYTYLLEHSSIN